MTARILTSAAAERLRLAVEGIEFVAAAGTRTPLTVSIGMATASTQTVALDTLLAAADAALYDAKRKGRNRVELARMLAAT